ncbi:MAG: hypothetical protein ABII12_02640 [Planctomycetota bacterium]
MADRIFIAVTSAAFVVLLTAREFAQSANEKGNTSSRQAARAAASLGRQNQP